MRTDIPDFISSLQAGVFEEKFSAAISEIGTAVVDTGKSGKITLTFDFSRIGCSSQVEIKHKITSSRPTERGKVVQEDVIETPMYVGPRGKVTLFPENQEQLFPKPTRKDMEPRS